MPPKYIASGKEVLRNDRHFADCATATGAILTVIALGGERPTEQQRERDVLAMKLRSDAAMMERIAAAMAGDDHASSRHAFKSASETMLAAAEELTA